MVPERGGTNIISLAGLTYADRYQVVLTCSSDLSIRVFSAKDGSNPRTLRGHTKAITSLHIIAIGRQVLSAGKDGTIRLWDVSTGKEIRKWEVEKRLAIEGLVVIEDERGKLAIAKEDEERVIVVACQDGHLAALPWSATGRTVELLTWSAILSSALLSIAYSPELGVIATGHTDGIITLRPLMSNPLFHLDTSITTLIRRNESPVYSLAFAGKDLLIGAAAGLPCRLSLRMYASGPIIRVKEEYAGWEAVGIEAWAVGKDGVWCAGGDGGIRRY